MGFRRRLTAMLLGLAAATGWVGAAMASGPGATSPWYLDQYGGDPADLRAFYNGRVGVVMPTAPRPMLFISWRLLHGLKVGETAGDALASPCCGSPWWQTDWRDGRNGWSEARKLVLGAAGDTHDYIRTDREGADNTSVANCFSEAFDLASATLKDRAQRYGAASREVKAWLAAQDAVFKACHDDDVALPPPLPNVPPWLTADRAYQQAALDLYSGRNDDAAGRFAAIAHDPTSPWRRTGLYLSARALSREAMATKAPAAYARAHASLAALAAAPADTFGRGQVRGLENALAFREHPRELLARLDHELAEPAPTPDIAVAFRDYSDLGDAAPVKPDVLDWIATMRAASADYWTGDKTPTETAARNAKVRQAALAHAEARWQAGRDPAWLIAALSLADPGEPHAAALIRDAEAVPRASLAWVSAQHHLVRLTLGAAPAKASRQRLDAILAGRDLSVSDRNIFLAQRTQVASSLDDFARHALRRRLCAHFNQSAGYDAHKAPDCVRARWDRDQAQPSGIYDGRGDNGATGLGDDARAIIDRAPLATRIALSRNKRLPAALRLDIALTSYGRAVQLQDNAALDALSGELARLLPLMAKEFADVRAAAPGRDKRFAEFLVLAKIPGLRTDLIDYTRPEGRRVVDYQYYWMDWVIPTRPGKATAPPPLAGYQSAGAGVPYTNGGPWPDAATDLTCLGECGRGDAPLRLPDFVAVGAQRAATERGRFISARHNYGQAPPVMPPGATDAWDEMLAYAQDHRDDPRMPEALHWLVHVGHFGGSHDHSGRGAFKLLHARYPGSAWAAKTPYYND